MNRADIEDRVTGRIPKSLVRERGETKNDEHDANAEVWGSHALSMPCTADHLLFDTGQDSMADTPSVHRPPAGVHI
jgi:hypothetical protein